MKKTTLRSIAKTVRNQLQWATLDRPEQVDYIQIFSDQRAKAHTFLVPADPKQKCDYLAYLHTLGRAVLCEQVHPLFAVNNNFAATTDKARFSTLVPALKVSTEWFVNAWLMATSPEKMTEHLHRLLAIAEKAISGTEPPSVPVFLDAAQIIAMAIRHLNEPIDCGGILKTAVDSFLAVDPATPSKAACEELVNRIMAFYTPMRARLIDDGGFDVWEIYTPDAAAAPPESAAPAD